MNRLKITLLLLAIITLSGCDDLFSYHPYDGRFDGDKNINANNIKRIEHICSDKDTIRFAFISDSHQWYGDTKDMVNDINHRPEIDFVIHGGDLTDCATTDEFVWMRDILGDLYKPYVALMGNHDMLGTGIDVYRSMYGDENFSFIAARVKFVCINTNAIEYDYMAAVPNFDYMLTEASTDTTEFDRTILCMHSRPYSDQFNDNVALIFSYFCRNIFPTLMFCINGHDHNTNITDVYGDGIIYYGVGSAEDRTYSIFTITPDGYEHETISF